MFYKVVKRFAAVKSLELQHQATRSRRGHNRTHRQYTCRTDLGQFPFFSPQNSEGLEIECFPPKRECMLLPLTPSLRGCQSSDSHNCSPSDTIRKRPERLWTTARTMEVLKQCPLTIALRLVHCAIAVSTAVLGQSHKDNVRCTALGEQIEQLEAKEVQLSQPSSTSLLMISSGLT